MMANPAIARTTILATSILASSVLSTSILSTSKLKKILSMSVADMLRREVGRRYARYGRYSSKLDRLNRLPLLRDFVAPFASVPMFDTREAMWEHLASLRTGPIVYLEFGVHAGHSIFFWARNNKHPDSRFVGFDTFHGLPEDWCKNFPKGHFDIGGQPPKTSDPRIAFRVGFFQDTLPLFLSEFKTDAADLVVHIDCDLYSSSMFCLTKLDPILRPGTVLIFDEFGDVRHEFRAFADYVSSYRRKANIICAHDNFGTAGLEIIQDQP